MDEIKEIKLKVLERTDVKDLVTEEKTKTGISYPNQTNPIYKKLVSFHNEKIGDKWSIKDLLR